MRRLDHLDAADIGKTQVDEGEIEPGIRCIEQFHGFRAGLAGMAGPVPIQRGDGLA